MLLQHAAHTTALHDHIAGCRLVSEGVAVVFVCVCCFVCVNFVADLIYGIEAVYMPVEQPRLDDGVSSRRIVRWR